MKLYTEEQVMQAYNAGIDDGNWDRYKEDIVALKLTPIELPSDEEMIPLENAFEFTQWMSGLIESNFMSNGNWYCNGEIKTTNQLYEIWMKEQILNQNK